MSLLLSMLPAVSAQEPVSLDCCSSTLRKGADRGLRRPDFGGKLHEITPQRVEDTYRYEGITEVTGNPSAFTDGSTVSSYAKKPMIRATAVGLINGVGNGRPAPTDTATRAQIATILTRYLQA